MASPALSDELFHRQVNGPDVPRGHVVHDDANAGIRRRFGSNGQVDAGLDQLLVDRIFQIEVDVLSLLVNRFAARVKNDKKNIEQRGFSALGVSLESDFTCIHRNSNGGTGIPRRWRFRYSGSQSQCGDGERGTDGFRQRTWCVFGAAGLSENAK